MDLSKEVEMAGGGYTKKHAKKGIKEKIPKIETLDNQFPSYEINIEIP